MLIIISLHVTISNGFPRPRPYGSLHLGEIMNIQTHSTAHRPLTMILIDNPLITIFTKGARGVVFVQLCLGRYDDLITVRIEIAKCDVLSRQEESFFDFLDYRRPGWSTAIWKSDGAHDGLAEYHMSQFEVQHVGELVTGSEMEIDNKYL